MNLHDTKIVKIWLEIAEQLKGNFSMPFQKITGGSSLGMLYLFSVDLIYKSIDVRIHKGIHEFPLQKDEYTVFDITITARKATHSNIELSIWRKDYFDKLFKSGKRTTCYDEFDKTIGLKASLNIEWLMPKVFENENLRKDFISDIYRSYNIRTIDNYVTIQRKSGLRFENSQAVVAEYKRFCRLLDGLINAQIISEY